MQTELVAETIIEFAERYPALLTVDLAAEIAGVSKAAIYEWSSCGVLDDFKSHRRGRLLLHRDAFVRFITA